MTSSLYEQHTREHPAYRRGFADGNDVGLAVSLNTITAERARQDDAAAVANHTNPSGPDAATHAYSSGRLHAVVWSQSSRQPWPGRGSTS
jgi:hypothetical protein